MTKDKDTNPSLKELPAGDEQQTDAETNYESPPAQPEKFFRVNFWFMNYRTSDTIQGAAILITILLLFTVIVVGFIGLCCESENSRNLASMLTYPLTAAIGVAIGRSVPKPQDS